MHYPTDENENEFSLSSGRQSYFTEKLDSLIVVISFFVRVC